MGNLDLFESACINVMPTVPERVNRAIATLLGLFRVNVPLVCAYSGGKDSSACAALMLLAARAAVAEGIEPLVVVTTSDTLMENPEIHAHYREELAKMVAYGKTYGFRVFTRVVQPSLASSMQVKILSGRALPSFAGQNTDCAIDIKQIPQAKWRKGFFKRLRGKGLPKPVTLLGLRYDESERRRLLMLARNDSDRQPAQNKEGDLVLSPLAWWLEDDVWMFLGDAAAGLYGHCYSDFEETKRIYAHSAGTSCAVVADAIVAGKPVQGGCGARFGCWVCQQADDWSLHNLLEYDKRYAYMRGLNRLNKFIRATRWDWTRRHWVGRTIKAGYIAIEPDTYHPTMIRELTRYMLQLDYDEEVRARDVGEYPRFKILSDEMLVAIDAYWSLNGLAQPFSVWLDRRNIREERIRYDVPEDVPTVMQTPMPPTKFLYVGDHWDETLHPFERAGLRDPMVEGLAECGPALRTLKDGRVVWDLRHGQEFDINVESASLLLDFELERMIKIAEEPRIIGGITAGYKFYAMYGVLELSHSQVAKHDEIMSRTAFKDRNGLTLEYDVQDLRQRAIDYRDLPAAAREAWKKKASADMSQTELDLMVA